MTIVGNKPWSHQADVGLSARIVNACMVDRRPRGVEVGCVGLKLDFGMSSIDVIAARQKDWNAGMAQLP